MCRPESVIDWEKVDQMLKDGCNGTEVACTLGIHPETFYDRVRAKFNIAFSEYKAQKQAVGDGLLKQAQMKKALKGDNSMLIWLGKQRLNQKDSHDSTQISEEIAQRYKQMIDQLSSLQSARMNAATINSNEQKS